MKVYLMLAVLVVPTMAISQESAWTCDRPNCRYYYPDDQKDPDTDTWRRPRIGEELRCQGDRCWYQPWDVERHEDDYDVED